MIPVRIQLRTIPGGWRVAVGHVERRASETDLTDDAITQAAERITEILRAPAVALDDARRSRREEEATAVLGSLLQAPTTLATLHGLLGEARGQQTYALVLVDAPEQPARSLPWELLGDTEAFETRGEAVVARLVDGRVTERPLEEHFTVVLATPDPKDPLCATRLTQLRALLDSLGIPHQDPTETLDGTGVLHFVAHGGVADAASHVMLPEGVQGPGTTAHRLAPLLDQVQLVVMDVCDAGHTGTEESQVAGARLVTAGAAAVIAPATRCGIEAAQALSVGLYTALGAGRPVGEALAEGRRAVRALGRPHPDSRWINPVLHVAGPQAALRALTRRSWRPSGWGPQSPEVAALLARARQLAAPHGFVGFEHLLAAWPESGGRTWSSHIRYLLAHRAKPLARLGTLRRISRREPDFTGTPRLKQVVPEVEDLEAFAQWLWTEHSIAQALLDLPPDDGTDLSLSSGTTLDPLGAASGPRRGAAGLEVVGGPEDGLRFEPAFQIGRAGPDAPGLYETSLLVDPYLSRRVLVWDAGGLKLIKPAAKLEEGQWVELQPGPIGLRNGDQLRLTAATRVRGL